MKRILFYTDTPILGGAENQMLLLAKYLPKDRYKVTLACANCRSLNPWCQQFMGMGIKVQRLKVWHKHDPRHFLYLRKILPKYDLLHIHVWNPASCRYAFLASGKKTVVITEHDPFPLSGIKAWIKNKLMKKVKAIIVASAGAKKLVMEQDPSLAPLLRIIPNGIDIEEWKAQSVLPEGRSEYRRTHFGTVLNEKIILCAAELHARKGQKYLIEAVKNVMMEFPAVKLVFAGNGPKRKYYEKLARPAAGRILFLGRRKDVAKLMAASDMFVLPSMREAFGLVILEAGVAGIPIIASRIGGIPEIIEDGKTGRLVEPGSAPELADAIKDFLKNPGRAAEMADAAKSRIGTAFNAKEMAQKTAEVYDSVLRSL